MSNPSTAKRQLTLQINDRVIERRPRETVLQAALRAGIEFPSGCRVGGCGACKCRLAKGDVRELTETGYLLTEEELRERTILACQSVPLTDLRVEVDLSRGAVAGHVARQERVTHDVTYLEVQLERPLAYRAGQFADLRIDGIDATRSYSFAIPARHDGRVAFFVRRVPGGTLSSAIVEQDLAGRAAQITGPAGDFWLRPSDAPLLFVAGGSGLAPILAILEEAAAAGVARPVTLLFGAREMRDLYALDRIAVLARGWKAPFRFVPVLSAEAPDSEWTGARGLLPDAIPAHLPPGAHAYLCGPPAMIDAAVTRLDALGVQREHVRFDRFTTRGDAPLAPAAASSMPILGVLHYLKYFLFHAIGLLSFATLLAGGAYTTAGLLTILTVYIVGDAIGGDDTTTPRFRHPWILTGQLWLALPLLALIVFTAVWSVCTGDPLGFGAALSHALHHDVLAARDATAFGHHVSGVILTGLMIGMVGTITGHELTHRTWDPVSLLVGRWLLAFSFDTSFAVEHVYGHHRYVSTTEDPATAPRGRNVYFHIVASTLKGNVSAWRIEAARLAKRRLATLSPHNVVLRGYAMSAVLVAIAYAMGGWRATALFVACALWGKALLEIVNYMEHYGMVRDPATPVEPRHSWNTNRRISSWAMFNLTRHSHHHAQGEVAYQDLAPYAGAPMMINGYLTTLVIAMIPPLWHRLMTPKVLAWDRDYASDAELRLAAEANARSGLAGMAAARTVRFEGAAHRLPT